MLPAAIEAGISYNDFFHMPPAVIKMQIELFYEIKKKEQEMATYYSWLDGYFTMYAIGVNFSKKIRYPKNPLTEGRIIVEDMELTEEEKIKWQKELFARLHKMGQKHKKANKKSRQT